MSITHLYYLLSYGSLSSVMMISSLKKTKTNKKKKKVKKKKHKLEEQVHKLVEQEQPPIAEAEPKTTLPEEELKQITQEPEKPSEKIEAPPAELKYVSTDVEEETDKQGYVKHEVKKGKKPSYVEQIKTEHLGEPGYIDPAAIKAGLPRKGYIESKGLLKDPMLEELKKKHEEDTKKEYEQRHKKMYEKKE